MSELAKKNVVDHGEKLSDEETISLKNQINSNWEIKGGKLFRHFDFDNFKKSRKFVDKIADLADEVNHHPDITFSFKYVEVVIYTHAIGSLAEGDFVLAAKIDLLT
mgnify:FL=1|jgi:4a-hydroxytetrahydrobiopterin dehydratase